MASRSGLVPVGVLALCAVAGCGVPAVSTGSETSVSPTSKDMAGAPHVPHPIDVSKFSKNPCSSLTPDQVQELHSSIQMSTSGRYQHVEGVANECKWGHGLSEPQVAVGFVKPGAGLSGVYYGNQGSLTPVAPIQGFPAVETTSKQVDILCSYNVGVSDSQAIVFEVDYGNFSKEQLCDAAKQVAEAGMKTIASGAK